MPAAPGTIEIGKFRIAYEEARASDGTQRYFLQQRALIRLNDDLVKIERPQDYTVLCDEENFTKAAGNRPSPLQYFIASISFCMFSQMARFAMRLDVPLDDAAMDLSISYDLSAKLRLTDFATAAQALGYRFDIQTAAPLERVIRLAQLTDQGCHTVNSMRKRIAVLTKWVYNGREFDSAD
jgi:uncharacterized OsmC-like protein